MSATIFVAVPSYTDSELSRTITTLYSHATQPSRVHVVVVDQNEPSMALHDTLHPFSHTIDYVFLHRDQARGVGMARGLAAQCYRGEDVYVQIDAHTYVTPGWDGWVEELMGNAPHARCVYSAFPSAYTVAEDGTIDVEMAQPNTAVAGTVHDGVQFEEGKWTLPFLGRYIATTAHLPAFSLAAGLVIGPGSMLETVPVDPRLYFYGEEQALAVRLFTHGYDLFHPCTPPFYHLYNSTDQTVRATPWQAAHDASRRMRWWEYEERSVARQSALYAGTLHGAFGLGTERTLADFAEWSGIDYIRRVVHPRAYIHRDAL